MRLRNPFAVLLLSLLSAACTPTVQLAMPNEPININLNVKIEHQIYIKVDKELDSLLDPSSGLF
ncbi:MAG: YnbE family lipoprotein [Pseudomonas sp.]